MRLMSSHFTFRNVLFTLSNKIRETANPVGVCESERGDFSDEIRETADFIGVYKDDENGFSNGISGNGRSRRSFHMKLNGFLQLNPGSYRIPLESLLRQTIFSAIFFLLKLSHCNTPGYGGYGSVYFSE